MNILTLIKSAGVRNFAKLLSANVVAQVIGLIVYPILTRIYSPEDFGLLNLFLSIGGVLTLISIAEYQYAVVIPKEEKNAIALFQGGFLLLVLCTVVLIFSVFFSSSISSLFNTPALASYYWMMPLYVLTMGVWNLLNYWYTRNKLFSRVSVYQVLQSTISSGAKIGLGYCNVLAGGMIYSIIIAPVIAILCSCIGVFRHAIKPLLSFSFEDIKSQLLKFKNFPLFVMPRALLNTVGGNLPVLLLTPYFGLSEIGFFGMAITLAFRPINIVCSSIYQVLFQKISDDVNKKKSIVSFVCTFLWKLGIVSVLFFLGIYFLLPQIVDILLGEDWLCVSDYIRYMLPWLFVVVLNTTISFLPDIFKKQHIYLAFEISYVVLRMCALVVGVIKQSITIAILLYSWVGALILLLELCWFLQMVIKYDKNR